MITRSLLHLGRGNDISEIFSPPRFTAQAAAVGVSPGFATDISVQKEDGIYWDLDKDEDVRELDED